MGSRTAWTRSKPRPRPRPVVFEVKAKAKVYFDAKAEVNIVSMS